MEQAQQVPGRYRDPWLWAEDLADDLFTALFTPSKKEKEVKGAKPDEKRPPAGHERVVA